MAKKIELSYLDMGRILKENGWRLSDYDPGNEYNFYDFTLFSSGYEVAVRAWLSDSEEGFSFGGELGVAVLEVNEDEVDLSLSSDSLKIMLKAIELAEDNLLAIGIPFETKYGPRNRG